jgi:hypothetical protein
MHEFQGKVAVITGAGSGLGRAIALQLNQAGAHLALCDLNMQGLEETRASLPDQRTRCSLHTVDVSDLEAMQQFGDAVLQAHGQVDLLVNNAGITLTPKRFTEIPHEQFVKVINVNQWGVYNGIRVFLPHLQQRPEASIVNISSLAGLVGLYGYSPYAMSKFAVRAISEALQMELAGSNVAVLSVHPGGVRTNIIKNAPDLEASNQSAAHDAFTKAATLTAEQAASQILKAVRKKRNYLVIGNDAKLVLLIRNLFPNRFPGILAKIFSRATFS